MMVNINKNGSLSNSIIQEKGMSSTNLFAGFVNYNSGKFTYDATQNQYTITSPVTSSTWGAGVNIKQGPVAVPYKMFYRVIMDVYVPSTHQIVIDINNSPASGSIQGGNDNDLTTSRTTVSWTIQANTWRTITWGSKNDHANNLNGVDIIVYDGIGLRTSEDTETITWYIKNPRIIVGDDVEINNQCSFSNNEINGNFLYEI